MFHQLFILFISVFSFSLCAYVQADNSHYQEDLKTIFLETYVNAEDMSDHLYHFVIRDLNKADSAIPPGKVIEKHKQQIASSSELQKKFTEILAAEISETEIAEVLALVQNPLYLKYRNKLLSVDMRCLSQSCDSIKELIDEMDEEETVPPASNVIELHQSNIHDVLSGSKYVVIDVYTTWCPPCKLLSPIIEELSQEYGSLYTFAALDYEEEKELGVQYGIRSFPTLLFIKDGKEVGRTFGFVGKDSLLRLMDKYFN